MRTLTLAGELMRAGFRVLYLCRDLEDDLKAYIRSRRCDLHEIPSSVKDEADYLSQTIIREKAVLVVFDHYGIDAEYERRVKEQSGVTILSFDDTYETHWADFLLNQNIYAKAEHYTGRVPTKCKVFAGVEYALLRDEFKAAKPASKKRLKKADIRILITMGGADEHNVALMAMKAVEASAYPIRTTVVCGKLNPHHEQLAQFAKEAAKPFDILRYSDDMAGLMREADIAITAAGATTIETLFMGLPSLVVTIADNQEKIADALQEKALALTLGRYDKIDASAFGEGLRRLIEEDGFREQTGEKAAALFKQDGVSSMIREVRKSLFSEFEVVEASYADSDDLLELANDAMVRKNSFSQERIAAQGHQKWLQGVLADPSRLLLKVTSKGAFVGQVRFDGLDKDECVISFSLSPLVRGLSMADKILLQAVSLVAKKYRIKTVIAEIKKENFASIRSFEKAGFTVNPEREEKNFIRMEYRL